MRIISIISALFLVLAIAPMPIGYYTFLRIVITITAVLIVVNEYKKGINFWVILFGITTILFNPIFPIYLYKKTFWIPIDIIAAILFFRYSFKKHE